MYNDKLEAVGTLHIELRDVDGNLKDSRDVKNLVVVNGRSFITGRMLGTTPTVMSHMAIGSGTVAADAANTALGTELGRSAISSSVQSTTTSTNDAVTYTATFAAGTGTGAVTEAALLNAASAGIMLSRTVFAVISKGASDSLTITWKVTLASA